MRTYTKLGLLLALVPALAVLAGRGESQAGAAFPGTNGADMSDQVVSSVEASTECAPLDLILVLDRSGSMNDAGGDPPQPLQDAKDAAKLLIDQLDPTIDRVGLVSYAATASLDEGLTDQLNDVKNAIDGMNVFGNTNIADGVFDAQSELDANGRPQAVPIMVVLSDGVADRRGDPASSCPTWPSSPTPCTNAAINEAATAKAKGTHIFTIGLNLDDIGSTHGAAVEDLARSTLQTMATPPPSENYFEAPASTDLEDIFMQIASDVCRPLGGLPVGGIAEYPDVAQSAVNRSDSSAGGSGSSAGNYALLAALAVVAGIALTAGAWYARRRWLQ